MNRNRPFGTVALSFRPTLHVLWGQSSAVRHCREFMHVALMVSGILALSTGQSSGSINGGTLARPISFSIFPDAAYPNYSVATSPGSLVLAQGSTASATVTLQSFNGFSTSTQCNGAWWGNLAISTRVSPSGSSAPSARVDPSCITLNPNATSKASLTVATMPFTQPGDYNVTVIAGFTVSPSGWSTGRVSTILVTVSPNVYVGPVIVGLGIAGAVASVILVRKSSIVRLLTTRRKNSDLTED